MTQEVHNAVDDARKIGADDPEAGILALKRAESNVSTASDIEPQVRDYAGWLREQHVLRQLADAVAPRLLSEVEERELWRTVIDTAESGFIIVGSQALHDVKSHSGPVALSRLLKKSFALGLEDHVVAVVEG